jgi:hypothetical protein
LKRTYGPCGVRCSGIVNLIRAFVELENLTGDDKGKGASGSPARPKVPTRRSGADCLVVPMRRFAIVVVFATGWGTEQTGSTLKEDQPVLAQNRTDLPSAGSTNGSQNIEIIRNGTHSASKGPAQNFTASVQVDPHAKSNLAPLPDAGVSAGEPELPQDRKLARRRRQYASSVGRNQFARAGVLKESFRAFPSRIAILTLLVSSMRGADIPSLEAASVKHSEPNAKSLVANVCTGGPAYDVNW